MHVPLCQSVRLADGDGKVVFSPQSSAGLELRSALVPRHSLRLWLAVTSLPMYSHATQTSIPRGKPRTGARSHLMSCQSSIND